MTFVYVFYLGFKESGLNSKTVLEKITDFIQNLDNDKIIVSSYISLCTGCWNGLYTCKEKCYRVEVTANTLIYTEGQIEEKVKEICNHFKTLFSQAAVPCYKYNTEFINL